MDEDGEGNFCCISCSRQTWNDDEVCDECNDAFSEELAATDAARPAGPLPPAPAAPVIKPLEWRQPSETLGDNLRKAETVFGTYRVWTYLEAEGQWFWSFNGHERKNGEGVGTAEEAVALATAHYTGIVSSCLAPAPAAPMVMTDAMVERFEAAMQGWVARMLELADGAVWTPSTEQARLILTETLAIVEDAERKINGSILQETPDAS